MGSGQPIERPEAPVSTSHAQGLTSVAEGSHTSEPSQRESRWPDLSGGVGTPRCALLAGESSRGPRLAFPVWGTKPVEVRRRTPDRLASMARPDAQTERARGREWTR